MPVNITNITNIDGFHSAGSYVSSITDGLFWGVLIFAIFIILVINLRKFGIAQAVASAGFSMLMVSIVFVYLGWLSIIFPIVFGLGVAGSIFIIRFSSA